MSRTISRDAALELSLLTHVYYEGGAFRLFFEEASRAFTGPGLVPRSRVLRLVPGPGYWAGPGSTGTETLKKGQKPRFRGNFGNDF